MSMNEIEEIITQIKKLKVQMEEKWNEKGQTDQEVLNLSIKIDELINKYNRLIKQQSCVS